jgi:hypothetical protein
MQDHVRLGHPCQLRSLVINDMFPSSRKEFTKISSFIRPFSVAIHATIFFLVLSSFVGLRLN